MRYYNPTVTQAESTYVPIELPWDAIAKAGAQKQGMQDKLTAELAGAAPDVATLSGDKKDYLRKKAEIDAKVKSIYDIGDLASNKGQVIKAINDIRKEYSPQGLLGSMEANKKAYDDYMEQQIKTRKESGWSEQEIRGYVYDQENKFRTLNQDRPDKFNQFQGKGVADYKDDNKWLLENLKIVAAQQGVTGLQDVGSLNDFTQAFSHGKTEYKKKQTIINEIAKMAMGDVKLMESLNQSGLFKGQEGWANFIKGKDKNGNTILNENTPFGLALLGAAGASAYTKTDIDYLQVKDPAKAAVATKKALEALEPVPFQHYGQPLEANKAIKDLELVPGTNIGDLYDIDKDGNFSPKPNNPTKDWSGVKEINANLKAGKETASTRAIKATVKKFVGTPFMEILKKEGYTKAVQKYAEAITNATNKQAFTTQGKNLDMQQLTDDVVQHTDPTSTNFLAEDGTWQNFETAAKSRGLDISNAGYGTLPSSETNSKSGKPSKFITDMNTVVGAYTMKVIGEDGTEVSIPVKSSLEVNEIFKGTAKLFEAVRSGETGEIQLDNENVAVNSWVKDENGEAKLDTKIYSIDPNKQAGLEQSVAARTQQLIELPEIKNLPLKEQKIRVKEEIEKENPGLELYTKADGKTGVKYGVSMVQYSDKQFGSAIEKGYFQKSKAIKEKETPSAAALDYFDTED